MCPHRRRRRIDCSRDPGSCPKADTQGPVDQEVDLAPSSVHRVLGFPSGDGGSDTQRQAARASDRPTRASVSASHASVSLIPARVPALPASDRQTRDSDSPIGRSDNVTLAHVLALPTRDRQPDDNDSPIDRSNTLILTCDTVTRASVLALLALDCQTDDSDTASGPNDCQICRSDNATDAGDSTTDGSDTGSPRSDVHAVPPGAPQKCPTVSKIQDTRPPRLSSPNAAAAAGIDPAIRTPSVSGR